MHNHHDTRRALPLASTSSYVDMGMTAYLYGSDDEPPSNKGDMGEKPQNNNWPGQGGDGYSWMVQILPFIEEQTLYNKLTQNVTSGPNSPRLGKLRAVAFSDKQTQNPDQAYDRETNPFVWEAKLETALCPSFPGEDEVPVFDEIGNTVSDATNIATGNYIALAAVGYDTSQHLTTGAPTANPQNSCNNKAYCGDGAVAFPGIVGTGVNAKVTKKGHAFRSLSDGTSKTFLIAESREETLTGWYSGLASYGVAAWPNNSMPPVQNTTTGDRYEGKWTVEQNNDVHSLNVGDSRAPEAEAQDKWYMQGSIHPHIGEGQRWGPSSAHPGVVQHGWGDGRAGAVSDAVEADVYLYLVTRAGRETVDLDAAGL